MTNAEKSSTEAQSENTGWESLMKGPEEVAEAPNEDAEYYKNHREKLGDLASRYIQLRGGLEHSKGGTWNAELRTKVDEDGLPVRWSDLTKYLRKNPDAVDTVFNALEFADKVKEAEAADAANVGAAESAEGVVTEEAAEQPEEQVQEQVQAQEQAVEAPAISYEDFNALPVDKKLDAVYASIDGIDSYPDQTNAWEKVEDTLRLCSGDVQSQVRYVRVEDGIKRDKALLKEKREKLKSISMWTKQGRDQRAALKMAIETMENSISRDEKRLELYAEMKPKTLSESDAKLVEKFRSIDTKMDRLNADLHVRDLKRKDIKMRLKWIGDQEKFMADDIKSGGRDEASYAKRREQIAAWKEEIAMRERDIAEYQKKHPDFVLEPSEKKVASSEQKVA